MKKKRSVFVLVVLICISATICAITCNCKMAKVTGPRLGGGSMGKVGNCFITQGGKEKIIVKKFDKKIKNKYNKSSGNNSGFWIYGVEYSIIYDFGDTTVKVFNDCRRMPKKPKNINIEYNEELEIYLLTWEHDNKYTDETEIDEGQLSFFISRKKANGDYEIVSDDTGDDREQNLGAIAEAGIYYIKAWVFYAGNIYNFGNFETYEYP